MIFSQFSGATRSAQLAKPSSIDTEKTKRGRGGVRQLKRKLLSTGIYLATNIPGKLSRTDIAVQERRNVFRIGKDVPTSAIRNARVTLRQNKFFFPN